MRPATPIQPSGRTAAQRASTSRIATVDVAPRPRDPPRGSTPEERSLTSGHSRPSLPTFVWSRARVRCVAGGPAPGPPQAQPRAASRTPPAVRSGRGARDVPAVTRLRSLVPNSSSGRTLQLPVRTPRAAPAVPPGPARRTGPRRARSPACRAARAAAACAGGRWVHSTTGGSSCRSGCSDAPKGVPVDTADPRAVHGRPESLCCDQVVEGTAAMSSATASSAVARGAPKQSEVKQVPVCSS